MHWLLLLVLSSKTRILTNIERMKFGGFTDCPGTVRGRGKIIKIRIVSNELNSKFIIQNSYHGFFDRNISY